MCSLSTSVPIAVSFTLLAPSWLLLLLLLVLSLLDTLRSVLLLLVLSLLDTLRSVLLLAAPLVWSAVDNSVRRPSRSALEDRRVVAVLVLKDENHRQQLAWTLRT